MILYAVTCTIALQVWFEGRQNTLRLDSVPGVELSGLENGGGLFVDFSKAPQLATYRVLDGYTRRVPANDCLYRDVVNGLPVPLPSKALLAVKPGK